MHCPADERLAAYLDGALGEAERDAIEAHAAACDACRATLAEAALAVAGLAEAAPPPPAALARAKAAGAPPAPVRAPTRVRGTDRRAPRPPLFLRFATAAVLVVGAALAATFFGAVPALGDLIVSNVEGDVEVRRPGEETWRVLTPGARVGSEMAVRTLDEDATVVFEGQLSMALRRDAQASLKPREGGVDLSLAAGAVALSPREGLAVRVEVPQGTVTSAGAPFEVHVMNRRRGGGGAVIVARPGAGVLCETPRGSVTVPGDQHTILFNDRAPMPARAFPPSRRGRGPEGERGERGERGPGRGRKGGGGRGREPCQPPRGPEVENIFKDGPT